MRALPLRVLKGSGNTFAWNSVKEFKALSTNFLCLGNNYVLMGTKCKLIDKGQENRVFAEH